MSTDSNIKTVIPNFEGISSTEITMWIIVNNILWPKKLILIFMLFSSPHLWQATQITVTENMSHQIIPIFCFTWLITFWHLCLSYRLSCFAPTLTLYLLISVQLKRHQLPVLQGKWIIWPVSWKDQQSVAVARHGSWKWRVCFRLTSLSKAIPITNWCTCVNSGLTTELRERSLVTESVEFILWGQWMSTFKCSYRT